MNIYLYVMCSKSIVIEALKSIFLYLNEDLGIVKQCI